MFANRAGLMHWQNEGQKTYGEIITHKAIEILKSQSCQSLPQDVRHNIAAIGKNAKAALLDKQFDV
jgi:trimethylamine:corrinoid methyltransferase-like protein